jgi:hypothetical protein
MFVRAASRVAARANIQTRALSTIPAGYTSFKTKWGADGKIEPHGGAIKENVVGAAKGSQLMSK